MPLSTASIVASSIGPNGTNKKTDLVGASAQACLVGGDAFRCQGKEVLVFNNADTNPATITIKAVADNFGNVLSGNDLTLTLAAGKQGCIGALDPSKYADSNGLVQLTYSSVTALTVGLFTFPVLG